MTKFEWLDQKVQEIVAKEEVATVQAPIEQSATEAVQPVVEQAQPTPEPAQPVVEQSSQAENITSLIDEMYQSTVTDQRIDWEDKPVIEQDKLEDWLDKPKEKDNIVDEGNSDIIKLENALESERNMRLRAEVEGERYKALYEQERSKLDDMLIKQKDLEWDNKKLNTSIVPEDVKTMVDFYRLAKETWNIYNTRNFVVEALKKVEEYTNIPTDWYLISWLKQWDEILTESPQASQQSNLTQWPDSNKWNNIIANIMS